MTAISQLLCCCNVLIFTFLKQKSTKRERNVLHQGYTVSHLYIIFSVLFTEEPPTFPPWPLLSRCVMKMDHHCPWINNCCGHLNHAYFTSFLLLAPLGCSHAAIIFIMTMYTQLYERVSLSYMQRRNAHYCPIHTNMTYWFCHLNGFFSLFLQISFGWSTVKIDMSAVRQFQPLMPFSVPAFAATLFALGLALGTTIAVGMLFFIQVQIL